MTPHAKAPETKLMIAVRDRLESGGLLADRVGLPDLKVRFRRNRYTTTEERPCFAIAFVGAEPVDAGAAVLSTDEQIMSLALDLILDLELETEASAVDSEEEGRSILDYDVTGLDDLMFVMKTAALCLRECCLDPLRDTTDLGLMCDWVQEVSVDDDEELPDDDGRLVGRINVIYRTSSWDPMTLLERE